ncbi:hypothetical protein [Pikeienuella sp. HZG-20]|uniref:hypothetical protein n=1 Tax=Paludibacillus litoralis TaxID=3133267 RepID=UPI0030EC1E02
MRHIFLLIVLVSAALAGFALWTIGEAPRPLDPRILQAAAAGALVGVGWGVTFLAQEYQRWRERETIRIETQMALRAEISDFAATVAYADLKTHGAEMDAAILGGDDEGKGAFHVFVPRAKNKMIFDMLGDKVRHVGPASVDHVIWFYSQIADVEAFAEDLNSAAYRRLPADRRAKAYRHYIQMTAEAKRRADLAIAALTAALGDGAESETNDEKTLERAKLDRRAERKAELRAWLNSRAEAPGGR